MSRPGRPRAGASVGPGDADRDFLSRRTDPGPAPRRCSLASRRRASPPKPGRSRSR